MEQLGEFTVVHDSVLYDILSDEQRAAALAEQEERERKRKEDWEQNKAPIMQALAQDLAAVFRKHGVYVRMHYEWLRPIEGPIAIEIGDSWNIDIAEDDGIVTKWASARGITHRIPAPSAHDKMAVAKLRADILAAAKGGAK